MTDTPEKPRGLWKLMNGAGGPADVPEEEATPTEAEERPNPPSEPAAETTHEEPVAVDETPAAAPKGLWSVMQQTAPADKAPAGKVETDAADDNPPTISAMNSVSDQPTSIPSSADRPKGLWGVMSANTNAANAKPLAVELPPTPEPVNQLYQAQTNLPSVSAESAAADSAVDSFVTADPPPAYKALAVKTGRSQKALAACLTGLFAVPFSALALLPEAWLRLPATVVGFAALMLGLLGWQDVRTSRGRQSGSELAIGGMVLGVFAMFLGPIVFARVGQGYRQTFGRQQTIDHLDSIGDALQSYHRGEGQFPAGGVFRVNQDDMEQPMHGWMTALLPYLDQQELHRSIRLDIPFDDPANRPAMRQPVNSFLAAGGNRDPVGGYRFAPAHFAGLGGELNIDDVGLVKVGIFGRNSNTTRDDITDGLSQTLIAGEISAFYPAWGEPENWRMIGRGLNRDSDGFGNAAGTGALFLRADGSVKFYGNKTDPGVLQKLSTPNAGDAVPEHLR